MQWLDKLALAVRRKVADLRHRAGARLTRAPCIRFERVDDFPDVLQPATLYVAGEEPYMWAAALLCPCGCGDVIELNLLEQASPRWTVRAHRDGAVTLTPSVWRTEGCRSHFIIRNGRIGWCRFDNGFTS